MKRTNKLLALALVLAMLCLAACGAADTASFQARMEQAREKTAALHSLRIEMTEDVSLELTAMGQSQSMDMSVSYVVDMDRDTGVSRLDMTINAMGVSQHMLGYSEKQGDVIVLYMSADNGSTWQKQTMDLNQVGSGQSADLAQMTGDPSQTMELFSKNASHFTATGKETINGSQATVYSGVLDGSYVEQLLQSAGMGSLFESMGVSNAEDALHDLGDIPTTIAIDDASGMVVRYTMDMSKVMQGLMENVFRQVMESNGVGGFEFTVSVHRAESVVTLSQFDAVGEITVPDAARGA